MEQSQEDSLPIIPKSIWEEDPSLREKSVINTRWMSLNDKRKPCNYCLNPNLEENHFYRWGFYSSKMRTDDYEKLLDLGFERSGTWLFRPDPITSCCPLYIPRLDSTEFKLSNQQKKHMKRFNQYINGDREFKATMEPIVLKDLEEIKKEQKKKNYESFLDNLKNERKELRELLFDCILNKGTFIDEGLTTIDS